jgi:aspartate racemase
VLHIGILAHSADGSALCYLEMVRHSARLLGAHEHPEITMSLLPMGPVMEAYRRDDLGAVRAHLAESAQRLADAGCDFFACPDNTAHLALETPGPQALERRPFVGGRVSAQCISATRAVRIAFPCWTRSR